MYVLMNYFADFQETEIYLRRNQEIPKEAAEREHSEKW